MGSRRRPSSVSPSRESCRRDLAATLTQDRRARGGRLLPRRCGEADRGPSAGNRRSHHRRGSGRVPGEGGRAAGPALPRRRARPAAVPGRRHHDRRGAQHPQRVRSGRHRLQHRHHAAPDRRSEPAQLRRPIRLRRRPRLRRHRLAADWPRPTTRRSGERRSIPRGLRSPGRAPVSPPQPPILPRSAPTKAARPTSRSSTARARWSR